MASLKDKILAAPDRKTESMEIPEWGVTVEIRGMSGRMRARFLDAYTDVPKGASEEQMLKVLQPLFPEFVTDCVFDPASGERVFERADIEAIQEKNGEVLQAIALKAVNLSGLGGKAVEEAGKSSSSTPSDASTSS